MTASAGAAGWGGGGALALTRAMPVYACGWLWVWLRVYAICGDAARHGGSIQYQPAIATWAEAARSTRRTHRLARTYSVQRLCKKTAETLAIRVSQKIARTVSGHAEVQISGRFGSNPAVLSRSVEKTGRPIPIQILRLIH